jgi:glucose/arabinose dehydrogenase
MGSVLVALLSVIAPVAAATLPSGFSETTFASGLSAPTAMAFAPDGRLFVCQQGGQLRVVKNGALLATPFVTVSTTANGERGLLGIAIDPNFAVNQFVYVYYTAATPATHNRVSRFTANGDVAVAGSETILFDLNNLSSATNHNGGALHFGPDGKLYFAAGENANSANSQVITNVLGKIMRLNSDGTIPPDNPTSFPGIAGSPAGNNRAIWSVGLRNPYTFTFQPGTGRMFINDVGQNTWEEINDGIAGSNYGWSICEGFCVPTNANFRDPLFEYGHGSSSTTGCAITGGAFYSPTNNQFPPAYVGKYFFGEYCTGWIRRFDPATGTAVDFASGISAPLDLLIGGDGSLYYLANGAGSVMRVKYTQNSISGRLAYADTPKGAKNVTMTLTAPSFTTQTTITDVNGDYSFTDLPLGNTYTVTPSKTGDVSGVESLDASFAARYAVGLDIPTANQIVAADADSDTIVTSFDASLIARRVAGLSGTGDVGTWKFVPASRTYSAFSVSQTNQGFTGILVGDASGSWSPGFASGDDSNTVTWGGTPASATTSLVDRTSSPSPAAPTAVTVFLPHVTGPTTTNITIPMTVGDLTGQGVKAYDLQITFDPLILQPQGTPYDTAGTVSSGMLITPNTNNAGHLIISAFQATDLTGAGTLINLKFTIVGAPGQVSPLTFADYTDPGTIFHPGFRFNAGTPAATTSNGSAHVNGPTASSATIAGRVIDAGGTPVSGAVVRLSGAQQRKTITDADGNYYFDSVVSGGFYTVAPSRANFVFSPGQRSFSQLGAQTDAVFTGSATGDLVNPLDTPEYFVRQQYVDLLGREPDEGGFNFWSDQILGCAGDPACSAARRRDVAAAFFVSTEFQDSGYFVYRLYQGAFGARPTFAQYIPDRNRVIGGANLDSARAALADDFVGRAEFKQAYPDSFSNEQFVNKLYDTAGLFPYVAERQLEINNLNHNASRSVVVQDLVDDTQFKAAEYNAAFVLSEYFAYLRRDPDPAGYDFWLQVLNYGEPQNYRGMVCSFVTSAEYQRRFSSVVVHSNNECGQ